MTLIHGQASVTIVVVETVFSSLAIVAIGLRIWARRLMKRRLSLNDWAAVAALVTKVHTYSLSADADDRQFFNMCLAGTVYYGE